MSKYCFIINPAARKGKGGRLIQTLKKEIAQRGLDVELHLTTRVGHAREIAANSMSPVVVAVGGDGTVNEIANSAIVSDKVLGIIPTGSGNDFRKAIGIPAGLHEALECLVMERTAVVDAALVRCWTSASALESNSTERYFVNGVGIGFDAAVAERTRTIKHLGGFTLYLAAVLQTLGRYRAPDFQIRTEHEHTNGRKLLIAVGNGPCTGGGFYLTPLARVDDGLLDLCLIENMSVPRVLALIPKVMAGRHEAFRGVRLSRMRELVVEAVEPFSIHADGEIVGSGVHRVNIQIQRLALKVIVGEKFKHGK